MDVLVFTSIHFTDNLRGLPMGVESLSSKDEAYLLGYQKADGFKIFTVGLNYGTPVRERGLRCLATGIEKAPFVAVARLTSADEFSASGDITDFKQVDVLFPGALYGAVGYGEFKVDLPLGSEAYYICSASTGSEVTTNVIKVISIIPVEVVIKEAEVNRTVSHI
jgi:hypothetical protein